MGGAQAAHAAFQLPVGRRLAAARAPPRCHPPAHLPRTTPALQEHTGSSSQGDDLLGSLNVPTTGMAKNLGSSGGSATLQRSKLSNKQSAVQRSPKLDDGMGGGGIGKGIFNGGGGDGDGGDDDDYFNEFGERILAAPPPGGAWGGSTLRAPGSWLWAALLVWLHPTLSAARRACSTPGRPLTQPPHPPHSLPAPQAMVMAMAATTASSARCSRSCTTPRPSRPCCRWAA